MTKTELTDILDKHKKWLNNEDGGERANLRGANLLGANLCDANLSNADLINADLDYSCLPLWCASLSAHFDDRQLKQIAYHLVKSGLQSKNASAETKAELAKLIDFANGFHRVDECGRIEPYPEKATEPNPFDNPLTRIKTPKSNWGVDL